MVVFAGSDEDEDVRLIVLLRLKVKLDGEKKRMHMILSSASPSLCEWMSLSYDSSSRLFRSRFLRIGHHNGKRSTRASLAADSLFLFLIVLCASHHQFCLWIRSETILSLWQSPSRGTNLCISTAETHKIRMRVLW